MAYTLAQEAVLKAASPIDFPNAVRLGVELGVSTKSVISKVQNMGLVYVRKEQPVRKVQGPTKADLVAQIQDALKDKVAPNVLEGLVNANLASLSALATAL